MMSNEDKKFKYNGDSLIFKTTKILYENRIGKQWPLVPKTYIFSKIVSEYQVIKLLLIKQKD